LLVVIAIIGILIALLLPAVQAAREAARRMQCTNNLKQLGLALHNYHSALETFPAGAYCQKSVGENLPYYLNCHTWIETLLPYMEQKPLHDRIDFDVPNNIDPNPGVLNGIEIGGLACPSDPDAGLMDNDREDAYLPGPPGTFSMAQSYPPSGGPLRMNVCLINDPETCLCHRGGDGRQESCSPGMFSGGPWCFSIRDCTDGTSKTFLIGENLPIYSTFMMYFSGHMNVATTNSPPNYYKVNAEGCPKQPTERYRDAPCYAYMAGFNSLHPGGVNICLTDGSVRFVSETIDYMVYNYLGNRSDGMTYPSPF
jgi:prepilin-type processing-associated H-X9-DG protein